MEGQLLTLPTVEAIVLVSQTLKCSSRRAEECERKSPSKFQEWSCYLFVHQSQLSPAKLAGPPKRHDCYSDALPRCRVGTQKSDARFWLTSCTQPDTPWLGIALTLPVNESRLVTSMDFQERCSHCRLLNRVLCDNDIHPDPRSPCS